MIIIGEFKDLMDNTILVEIENPSVSANTIVIGEKYNEYDEQDGEIYFSDEPIELEQEMDDMFTVIAMQSATINILTKHFIGDKLFATGDRQITVKIYKNNNIIFDGYAEAGTYNQPFTNPYDEYTINCIDKLSTLEYHKYKDINVNNFESILPSLGVVTFRSILDDALSEILGDGNIYYDMSKGINSSRTNLIFNDLKISEQEMVGDDFDSVWTTEDTLTEMLRYLNLHIRQIGSDFYIFDWDSIKNKETEWVNLLDNELVTFSPSTVRITQQMNAGTDTEVSIDEVYSQVQVQCELNDQENLIESPLDSGNLTSVFTNRQKYMTEYISEGEGQSAFNAFKAMILNEPTDYDACKRVDWYIQWLKSKNWKLYHNNGQDIETLLQQNSDGTYINQYMISYYLRNFLCEPAIISLGHVDHAYGTSYDDSPTTKISTNEYLVISLNGTHADNGDGCVDHYPDDSDLQTRAERGALVEYLGANSGGVYSPTDDETTNYMVFSGKLCFMPIQQQTETYTMCRQRAVEPSEGYYIETDFGPVWVPTSGWQMLWHHTVPSDNNGDGRYYTRKWYWMENVNDDPSYAPYSDTGFHPLTEDKSNHELPFNYSADWEWGDLISNLDVLECELIIGNKRLIQRQPGSGQKETLQWVTLGSEPWGTSEEDGKSYKITTFQLGINPKIDDKIVGDEFPIRSNLDFTANINAEGFAVPIKKSDALSGQIIFRILGPVNTVWNSITRRHPTFFRSTKWYDHKHYVLAHSESIIVKDFKCQLMSDNAGVNTDYTTDDKDLIYISNETTDYNNVKDDITFKFITQPTLAEALAAQCSSKSNYNAVVKTSDGLPVSTIYSKPNREEYKAEKEYVAQYYLEYNEPKILLDMDMWDNNFNYLNIYKYNALNRDFIVRSMTRTLVDNKIHLTMKEV